LSGARIPDEAELQRVLRRGVAEIIPEEEFVRRLRSGRPLRLKMGFDPTRPVVTLGWAVGLRKLRQLQGLGHLAVLIIGDVTAQIGDPSGQSETRPMLTAEEVEANAEAVLRQFFRVLDPERTEVRRQSEWFTDFRLGDVVRLAAQATVAQLLQREDFALRYEQGRPIGLHEFIYPLLQAYDSVAVRADVEFGGTDQKFNILMGRELQPRFGQEPQCALLMPLLVGLDGERKMSQSLGNYIAIDAPPHDMFGKLMSLPDHLIMQYLELLTDVPEEELEAIARGLRERSLNPMEAKMRMAREVVAQFHGPEAARAAQEEFERVFRRHALPSIVNRWPETPPPHVEFRMKLDEEFIASRVLGTIRALGQEPVITSETRTHALAHIIHAARLTTSVKRARELIAAGLVARQIGDERHRVTSEYIRDLQNGDVFWVEGRQLRIVDGRRELPPPGVIIEFKMSLQDDYRRDGGHSLPHVLNAAGVVRSVSEGARLIRQGGVTRIRERPMTLARVANSTERPVGVLGLLTLPTLEQEPVRELILEIKHHDIFRVGRRYVRVLDADLDRQ
jgi:tyrosyl-tRNA synthetase